LNTYAEANACTNILMLRFGHLDIGSITSIDRSGNIELGSPLGKIPEIKNNNGIFGGIINKLPPELRRAGRDVLNDLRRRVPLGRVTGGRVFPPFKIPPLNI
jgi:hypothetical protein